MKFIHAADLHIDSPLRGLTMSDDAPIDAIRSAPREAFRRLVQLALAEEVDFVILAGDVFDGEWRDIRTGLFFNGQLKLLGDIPVYIARGNHDAEMEVLKKVGHPKNTHTFKSGRAETIIIESVGVAIHGQSYARRAIVEDLAAGYPKALAGLTNIGVLHTSLAGYAAHETYAPCSLPTLLGRGYDYWALGHVHVRQVVCEAPLVVYPGNIQGRHFRETGPKGCYVIEGDRDTLRATFHELDVVRWFDEKVDVSGVHDGAEAVSLVQEHITAIQEANGSSLVSIRVEMTGSTGAHGDLVNDREIHEATIRSHVTPDAWLAELRIGTTPVMDLAAIRRQDDLQGSLFRSIEELRVGVHVHDGIRSALRPLKDKLPPRVVAEYQTRLDDKDFIRNALDGAERILLAEMNG